jgi:hypothetical protein
MREVEAAYASHVLALPDGIEAPPFWDDLPLPVRCALIDVYFSGKKDGIDIVAVAIKKGSRVPV